MQRFGPTLGALLDSAVAAGEIRGDLDAEHLLHAVANLCLPLHVQDPSHSQRMVALLVDGLRFGSVAQRRAGA